MLALLVASTALARLLLSTAELLGILTFAVIVPGALLLLRQVERRAGRTITDLKAGRPLRDCGHLAMATTLIVASMGTAELVHLAM